MLVDGLDLLPLGVGDIVLQLHPVVGYISDLPTANTIGLEKLE